MTTRRDDQTVFRPEQYPKLTFDAAHWEAFVQACGDLDIPVDDSKRPVLEALYSHLRGVNEWMNLTKLTEPADFLKFHVLDSLTAFDVVDELSASGALCVDLGSGGGYPGLPLMTWLPDRRWVLVDSRQKKVAFLKEAVKLTPATNASAAAFRGREVRSARPDLARHAALVTARAVGRADRLLVEAVDLLKPGGFLLLLKGPAFADDERDILADIAEDEGFEFVNEMTVSLAPDDPERFLVLLRKAARPPRHRR